MWYSIRKPSTKSGVTVVHLFGEIGVGQSDEEFIAELGDAPVIELRVDCPGGGTNTGLAVYDALQGREVSAIITGHWGSAAIAPVMAAKSIACISTARILVHPIVDYVLGNAVELRLTASVLERLTTRLEAIICSRTKIDTATVRAWLTEGDHWFSAPEALKLGLVDQICDAPKLIECLPVSETNLEGSALDVPSEEEVLFNAWLRAFGKVPVRNRERFLQNLNLWAFENVTNL